ncbi:hypothetical protein N0B31_01835 [Salinirubellus salinus]|uniref:Uncharacterized protein n=1 Tax=Salinirubellus salinus TaxID=1364945 RepID=A0A9E7R3M9_9EURY|nr:hypothetical protein [Salinirubellus salinus]UWM55032.1 hypothetical protein N0B31_01835 [Salinirubellus salinus]
MLTVELTVDDITGTLLDAIDDVAGVRSIAVDGTTLTVHFDGADTTPIRRAVESVGAAVLTFSQRATRTFDPAELERTEDPFDIGSTIGET